MTGAETSLRPGLVNAALGPDWRSNTLNPVRVDVDVLSVKFRSGVSAGAATNIQLAAALEAATADEPEHSELRVAA